MKKHVRHVYVRSNEQSVARMSTTVRLCVAYCTPCKLLVVDGRAQYLVIVNQRGANPAPRSVWIPFLSPPILPTRTAWHASKHLAWQQERALVCVVLGCTSIVGSKIAWMPLRPSLPNCPCVCHWSSPQIRREEHDELSARVQGCHQR